MPVKNLPNVGDVIKSKKFAFGYYDEQRTTITVDGLTKKHPVTSYMDEKKRLAIAAKSGQIPPAKITRELGAYDPGRAKAMFVVEEARLQGGSRSGHDDYPDGWHVKARRLAEMGNYSDPNGELICFYMNGCFNCLIALKDVRIVGRMRRTFVWGE